ncbi:NAD(P)-dependent dehydrogenase, short-chain alcohol dehydrogenase family [Sinosporangium album]|uniref:NAD(P)-dependent dehydrogenase, short-chain alcohol dehydrogenase family n=1 Tax=Sinosporangium album TaxID=504805 RepID=A0A1G7RZ71_9ACTN|nr:oxidoreductase [Sinosporangium album]SDG16062.1 NAD(P)-dependent dehydrogenase, short-chain alcohol dehydrogenase family [Sinosporangium album]
MRWTAADIPDQTGKTAIVTGASSGLGMITAGELARRGASVVLACRDVAKGNEAAARMRAAAPDSRIKVLRLNLADLHSVREFADTMHERCTGGVDLLVNNAGIMAVPYRTTSDGFELQFGTNHLGHFALTGLVMPLLLQTSAPRVVTVSSGTHRAARIDFKNLNAEGRYGKYSAYAQSKLANLLFALELDRRAEGTSLVSVAAHPGYAATNLQVAGPRMDGNKVRELASKLSNFVVAQSKERGALPLLHAATKEGLRGGSYVGPDGMFEQRGYPTLVEPAPSARDAKTARRLWEVSEDLTGVRYEF